MRILYLPSSKSQQRQLEKPNFTAYPILMAMECEKRRQEGDEVYWDSDKKINNPIFDILDSKKIDKNIDKVITKPEGLDFLSLPKPDRVFTRAMDKKYQSNGNFKYLPGTYIQSANGCWHGKCSFCVEKDKPYLVRPVDSVIEEIEECKSLGFRELFDDSATFPQGGWLDAFLERFYTTVGFNRSIRFSCNCRLFDYPFRDMYRVGFRMVLFGIESANQRTLDIINKGTKTEDIKYVIKAAKAGLEPHIAVMFGYPWENDNDSINTLRLVHYLLKRGYAKTAQASFYCPRDGKANESQRKYVSKIYDIGYSPTFWLNTIKDIRNVDDLKYLWRAIKKGLYESHS